MSVLEQVVELALEERQILTSLSNPPRGWGTVGITLERLLVAEETRIVRHVEHREIHGAPLVTFRPRLLSG